MAPLAHNRFAANSRQKSIVAAHASLREFHAKISLADATSRESRMSKLSVIIGINQLPTPNSIQNRALPCPEVSICWSFQGLLKMPGSTAFTSHLQPNDE